MHMKLHVWKTVGGLLFCLGASALASAGCSSSSTSGSVTIGIPAGCSADDGLDCSGGGQGVDCPSGTTPDETAGICSVPSPQSDGTDGFCCIDITDTGCSQDDSVTGGCDYPSYGFSCTSGSPDPSTEDASLTCSTAVADPDGNDDYCCADNGSGSSSGGGSSGGSTIPGCASDSGLDCAGGGEGISCPSGTTPDDSAGVCSVPQDNGDGTDGFCCIPITDTGCSQDDSVTGGCDYPSYGFSCTSGSPDPSTDDPSLTCSTAVTDPTTGDDDYCCSN
jgi:hypothetical protein